MIHNENIVRLKEKVHNLTTSPGVYKMLDRFGNIIYVGKAKNLRNRVSSYFVDTLKAEKVLKMVENIYDFEYIIVTNELEALSLESNLIKQNMPYYNILLKDDKAFPYIKINLNEKYPKVNITRKIKKDNAKYFGPYFKNISGYSLMKIISNAFKLRDCKRINKKTACLNYHIEKCLAPCINKCTPEEYKNEVDKVIAFLKGDTKYVEQVLINKMNLYSNLLEFEKAIEIRDIKGTIKRMQTFLITGNSKDIDIDIYGFATNGGGSAICVGTVRGGKMVGMNNYSIINLIDDEKNIVESFITQYYSCGAIIPSTVIVGFDCEDIHKWINNIYSEYESTLLKNSNKKININKNINSNTENSNNKNVNSNTENSNNKNVNSNTENSNNKNRNIEKDYYTEDSDTNSVEKNTNTENNNIDENINNLNYNNNTNNIDENNINNTGYKEINNSEENNSVIKNSKNKIKVIYPKSGINKKLLDMANANALEYVSNNLNRETLHEFKTMGAIERLQKLLNLKKLPKRIEGYDISNLGGTNTVASMVVFINGEKCSKHYRKFKIETLGQNDFLNMKNIIHRRINEYNNNSDISFSQLPDLILIDGGEIQLRFAYEEIIDNNFKCDIISLAKKIEEIYIPNKEETIILSHDDVALKLLQNVRDESHRFAITFQKQRRLNTLSSQLSNVAGLGKNKINNLYKMFGSMEKIKLCSIEELCSCPGIGQKLAKDIIEVLTDNK